jgi:hypothetical protein
VTDQDLIALLLRSEVLIRNKHFVLDPDTHSSEFIDEDAAFTARELRAAMVPMLPRLVPPDAGTFLATADANIILATMLAVELSRQNGVPAPLSAYAWRDERGRFTVSPSFATAINRHSVIVVSFLVDSMETCSALVDLILSLDGAPVQIVAVWNTTGIRQTKQGVNIKALIEEPLDTFPAAACPLCESGVPIDTRHGHGTEYLETLDMLSDQ